MKKTSQYLLAISLLIVMSGFFVPAAKAGLSENGGGWSWGGGVEPDGSSPWNGNNTNVGWVSMNSLNCDADGNGTIDNSNCISAGASGNLASYGVNIPPSTGDLSGYAWSENLGWINFGPWAEGSCPPLVHGACTARRTDNHLEGWARIMSIAQASVSGNAGGWTGWISLSGSNYGVSIINTDPASADYNKLTGYAWSDELGWIDFSRAFIAAPPSLLTCPAAALIPRIGGSVDLKACLITLFRYPNASCAYKDTALGSDFNACTGPSTALVTGKSNWWVEQPPTPAVVSVNNSGHVSSNNIFGSAYVHARYNLAPQPENKSRITIYQQCTNTANVCNESTGYVCKTTNPGGLIFSGTCPTGNCAVTGRSCQAVENWKEVKP